jgi:TFIIF-interacting CTD phosphatase-like protein
MRPYLKRFLVTLHKFYDIYIFTAATMSYLKDMLHRIEENKGGI